MIPIFIGYDRQETVAFHVLTHSIINTVSEPVAITPLYRKHLYGSYWRRREKHDSTDFSNSRFLVPHLMDFKGWAIFIDCDMVARTDFAQLWEQRDDRYAVMVRQQTHDASGESAKFLGHEQAAYNRKNWSSLILFNCARCTDLTLMEANHEPGLFLHQFRWLDDSEIGAIEGAWNHLVGITPDMDKPDLIHFTRGGPWFGVEDAYSHFWWKQFEDMLQGDNPVQYRHAPATTRSEKT